MTNRTAVIGLVMLIVVMAGLLYYARKVSAPTTSSLPTTQEEAAVRAVVTSFGQQLKNVSLLAPDAAQQIASAYGQYVSPELIQTWAASTTQAPGRLTSSPWPDSIVINSVTPQGGIYQVAAEVVEMTSATSSPATTEPVQIELENRGGVWMITHWQPQLGQQ